jgi:hypothetical protein
MASTKSVDASPQELVQFSAKKFAALAFVIQIFMPLLFFWNYTPLDIDLFSLS